MCARGGRTALRTKPAGTSADSPPRRPDGLRTALVGLCVAVAAVVPVLAASVGRLPLAAVIAVEGVLLGRAWVRALGASTGTLAIVLVAALAADATAALTDSDGIGNLAGVIGPAVVAVILVQLARRRGRAEAAGAPPRAGLPAVARARQWSDHVLSVAPVRRLLGAGRPRAAARRHGSPAGRSATVTVDMAAGLSGVVLVALLAGCLNVAAIRAPDGRVVGPTVLAAGLLGAGTAVLVTRLCAVRLRAGAFAGPVGTVGPAGRGSVRPGRRAGGPAVALAVVPAVGLAAGIGAGALLGGFADDSAAWEAALIAAAAAVAAVVADRAVARAATGICTEPVAGPGGAAVPAGVPGQAPHHDGHPAGWPLVAILPLAAAAAFVYAVGHLLLG
ncbi:hypothetical protein [Candidatus Protofrankia datiscae]|uniref:hypothetical protein n=1 Tax=Candidatus Protofrankia datiscae TaxID=2716812 RepID=UPI0005B7A174|nr:hypothetical protein [Candidatus Protofrankia datiscae]